MSVRTVIVHSTRRGYRSPATLVATARMMYLPASACDWPGISGVTSTPSQAIRQASSGQRGATARAPRPRSRRRSSRSATRGSRPRDWPRAHRRRPPGPTPPQPAASAQRRARAERQPGAASRPASTCRSPCPAASARAREPALMPGKATASPGKDRAPRLLLLSRLSGAVPPGRPPPVRRLTRGPRRGRPAWARGARHDSRPPSSGHSVGPAARRRHPASGVIPEYDTAREVGSAGRRPGRVPVRSVVAMGNQHTTTRKMRPWGRARA